MNEQEKSTLRCWQLGFRWATASAVLTEAGDFHDRYQDSATKSQLSIRKTPQSISVVTRESIEARQALDLSSAVELVAGVAPAGKAFAGHNPRTGESFVLRGQWLEGSRDIRIDGFKWVDAEYIDRQDPNFGRTPGGVIERQAALYTNYEWQSGPLHRLELGATLLSVGDRIVLSDQNYDVDGYERIDLHASFSGIPRWKLSLLVRNLTDERYIERPNSAYLYGHFFGSPRAALLRAEYAFQ